MKFKEYFLFLSIGFLPILLLFSFSYSQEEAEIFILHPQVGKMIDREENIKYDLFSSKAGFKMAVFYKTRQGDYLLKIATEDLRTGEKIKESFTKRQPDINRYRNKIEYFDIKDSSVPVKIDMKNGRIVEGIISSQDMTTITVLTPQYTIEKIPRQLISSKEKEQGLIKDGVFYRADPNYSRLLFAQTGRMLGKGDYYVTNHYLFVPGVTYGITDWFSCGAGGIFMPFYQWETVFVAPKIGKTFSDKFAFSTGTMHMYSPSDYNEVFGLVYAMGTYGRPDRNITAGIGIHYIKFKRNIYNKYQINGTWHREYMGEKVEWKLTERPVIIIGGNLRLSKNVSLVSENWLFAGDWLWGDNDFRLKEMPFGIALRYFSKHAAIDFGLILIPFVLKESHLPIQWLSFGYNF